MSGQVEKPQQEYSADNEEQQDLNLNHIAALDEAINLQPLGVLSKKTIQLLVEIRATISSS